INSGNTNLDSWNTNSRGDIGDWAASAGNDAFLAFSPSGQINGVTPTDLTLMNVLGWDPASGTIASGQTTTGMVLLSGDALEILSGGTAINATLSGGAIYIDAGGNATGTRVSSGGLLTVSSGGIAGATMVYAGGLETVRGSDGAAQISGGEQDVFGL